MVNNNHDTNNKDHTHRNALRIKGDVTRAAPKGIGGMRAELCGRFIQGHYGDAHLVYDVDKWAHRFAEGTEWFHMDDDMRMLYLRILTTPAFGTAGCIDYSVVADFVEWGHGRDSLSGGEKL